MSTTTYTHCTVIAPGCHGGPDRLGVVVSRHRSAEAAIRAASKNDRLVACTMTDGRPDEELFQLPAQGSRQHGPGRYGRGQ